MDGWRHLLDGVKRGQRKKIKDERREYRIKPAKKKNSVEKKKKIRSFTSLTCR